MPNKAREDLPLTRRQGALLMFLAITIAAAISIAATVIQSNRSDSQQDRHFDRLCATSQRIAATNAFRITADAVAFRQAARAIEAGNSGPGNPISAALYRAAVAADVAADAQDRFAESRCEDLPPLEDLSIDEIRRGLNAELVRLLARERQRQRQG